MNEIIWIKTEDRNQYKVTSGKVYEMVCYSPRKEKMFLWEVKSLNDFNSEFRSIYDFDVDELKGLGVYNLLKEEQKNKIEENNKVIVSEVVKKMEKIRKQRKPLSEEFIGIPKELICSKCGKIQKASPQSIVKRAKTKNMIVEEWIKQFVCLECDPSQRGRKASGKYINMPHELKCNHEGCTFVVKTHPSMIEKMAKSKNIPFNEFVSGWKCREHREKIIRNYLKKGKKASGKYNGMTNKLTCNHKGCNVVLERHPCIILKEAEKKGLTFDAFLVQWKCKEHRKV